MNLDRACELARQGSLYPAVLLHGARRERRRREAVALARTLLCEGDPRPCGACRHCRRIALDSSREERFHPDFLVLERDLRTATSVEAARQLVRGAGLSPFEARGQVFVVADAETLSPGAADALLKALEEPHLAAPRHFLLLAPSQFDLPATLRSRSLKIYLGAGEMPEADKVAEARDGFSQALRAFLQERSPVYLLAAARALEQIGGWEDPRQSASWMVAARAVVDCCRELEGDSPLRGRLLGLAQALLRSQTMRIRGVPPGRILEGAVCEALALDREPRG